ncbi:MAG: carboxy-S-adenosyl-L-methionine synthase CmoA [Chitinophagales bacterium]|nr:carboxy-S-adenosyl-L-methionine synthase CmoA [Bacteroidota bacterium]
MKNTKEKLAKVHIPNSGKDEVFNQNESNVNDFKFGAQVAIVFDDMVSRSVPFYAEIQRMITDIAADFASEQGVVYDLGCSTGTTMLNLNQVLPDNIAFVGIDDSDEMLKRCDENLKEAGFSRPYSLVNADLNKGVQVPNASVVVMCLTLQFIRPLYRQKLIKDIYDQLLPNGCLILVEKVLGEYSLFNRHFIKYYYDMKRRNNYSELEISQKREALENILIPYKLKENEELLLNTGFSMCETFFKWYNFSAMVAVK